MIQLFVLILSIHCKTTIMADESVKLIGVHLERHLDFNKQIKQLCRKAACQLNVLQRLARHLDQEGRMAIFRAFIVSHFNYCPLVWHFCGATNTKKLERIQFRALRCVFLDFESDYDTILDGAGLPILELSRKRAILMDVYKNVMYESPAFMWNSYTPKLTKYNLRNTNTLCVPQSNTTRYGLQTLTACGAKLWNSLPNNIKSCTDFNHFKSAIETWQEPLCKCRMCRPQVDFLSCFYLCFIYVLIITCLLCLYIMVFFTLIHLIFIYYFYLFILGHYYKVG